MHRVPETVAVVDETLAVVNGCIGGGDGRHIGIEVGLLAPITFSIRAKNVNTVYTILQNVNIAFSSVVVKDLRLEDKDKDLWSEDKDKDLKS